jgi:competence protein ComEC
MAELPYDCDVLMAPHHGSRQSDPPGFAAWSTPELVVISGGHDDSVDSVTETYSRAGARVVKTHERGRVHVRLNSNIIQVATFRGDETHRTILP